MNVREDLVVVRPRRVAEVDRGFTGVETGEEEGAEMNGSCAGNGLN